MRRGGGGGSVQQQGSAGRRRAGTRRVSTGVGGPRRMNFASVERRRRRGRVRRRKRRTKRASERRRKEPGDGRGRREGGGSAPQRVVSAGVDVGAQVREEVVGRGESLGAELAARRQPAARERRRLLVRGRRTSPSEHPSTQDCAVDVAVVHQIVVLARQSSWRAEVDLGGGGGDDGGRLQTGGRVHGVKRVGELPLGGEQLV